MKNQLKWQWNKQWNSEDVDVFTWCSGGTLLMLQVIIMFCSVDQDNFTLLKVQLTISTTDYQNSRFVQFDFFCVDLQENYVLKYNKV